MTNSVRSFTDLNDNPDNYGILGAQRYGIYFTIDTGVKLLLHKANRHCY